MKLPYPVVLGSKSPRRVEILRRLVGDFEQDPPDLDEDAIKTLDPWQSAETLAQHKARAVFERWPGHLVVAGDTVVAVPLERVHNGKPELPGGVQAGSEEEVPNRYELLGKPESEDEAREMLRKLSGRNHVVISGCSLLWPDGHVTFSDTSVVRFRELNEKEIDEYVATGEPMDKAGGYAIQGKAESFATVIEGSWANVVGLPEERLKAVLEEVSAAHGEQRSP